MMQGASPAVVLGNPYHTLSLKINECIDCPLLAMTIYSVGSLPVQLLIAY